MPRLFKALAPLFLLSLLAFSISPLLSTPISAQELTAQNRDVDAQDFLDQGFQQINAGQVELALESFQQALALFQETGNRQGEAYALVGLGRVSEANQEVQDALSAYEAALPLFVEVGDRPGEGIALTGMGVMYGNLGRYEQALGVYENALAIFREVGDRQREGDVLNNIGAVQNSLGQQTQALEAYQQALETSQELGDRLGQGITLNNIGLVYDNLGRYEDALYYYQQALSILDELEARASVGGLLNNIGAVYNGLGQYEQALDYYQQALDIRLELGDRRGEGVTLNNMGLVYENLGQYERALASYQQALDIRIAVGDSRGEGITLSNIGLVYDSLGQYEQALDHYQQALAILTEVGDRNRSANIRSNIGALYTNLGQYQQALEIYQQALAIETEVGDRAGQGITLNNIGTAHEALGQHEQALSYYQQALAIRRDIGDRRGEGVTLSNIGVAYSSLGDPEQALNYYQQALTIRREVGDRTGEGDTLNNIGLAYTYLGQSDQALATYQQALAIRAELGDRAGEGTTLTNIGYTLDELGEAELAIIFFKQAVNRWEEIRGNIRGLTLEQQQTFTDRVSDSYRRLADLLLQADRVLEAQRVLDLLQVQELDEYLQDVRGNADTESGVALLDPEVEISNRAIAIGYELAALRAIPVAELTDEQRQRLAELDAAQRDIIQDFQAFINSPDVQALVAQLQGDVREQDVLAELDEFINLQNNLQAIDQNAVLIYPLILADRLEVVLITPFSEPTRYPVPVGRNQLNETIVAFRQALDTPDSNPEAIAQQLYDWLIAPMASDLEAIGAETLLYAPDGALRYIPLAALHDGDRWLIERFRINHITASSLQDFTLPPTVRPPQILAAAFSEGLFAFDVGQRSFSFGGLPFAGTEVENLVTAFPGTTQLMNEDFSRTTLEPIMDSHTIVHLATHAAFVPGSPRDSFILFGNGDRLTLQEIREEWRGRFNQVDLIVLSACETGLGGDTLGTGEEILGFGYLMQEAGAEAAIASLWQVSDGGTQVLMDAFYAALNNGYSKAEALQRAQLALITSDQTVLSGERGERADYEVIDLRTGQPLSQSSDLAHPYYWAPFILIGNGL
ncbi:tetratricopeptide repeat protein [Vacuolonema iberomarrocanum]|uniref:CHAT domain-containing protein n=1 Tax=Vacuolonema iberomarrocanum TaxID=3454632 RepID=UPI0019EBE70D|nr:tetratricopeptide repeat protein [filamentous cyanobacterium LEGE 07170]